MAASLHTHVKFVKDPAPSLTNLKRDSYQIPNTLNEFLQTVGKPHVESFDFLLEEGLSQAVKDLDPEEVELPDGSIIKLQLTNVELYSPRLPDSYMEQKSFKINPSECRQRKGTYKGRLFGEINWTLNGIAQAPIIKEFGEVPVMVKSKICWLAEKNPKELVQVGEHEDEFGGYFITKGHERLVRMLLMSRKNYPMAVKRSTWKTRGSDFSEMGIILRSVQDDQTATTNVLHYLKDGTAKLMFSYRRIMYFVPVFMFFKACMDVSDVFIFNELTRGRTDDDYFVSCVMNMLNEIHQQDLHTQSEVRQHLGRYFRSHFINLPSYYTEEEVCLYML
ncbi:hypothetical protein J437_LFUL009753, partial [Ladona fulva]